MDSVVDVLIAGGGPAGLTAALTLARQLHTAVVFDNKSYRNANVSHMHMIPTWDHRNPAEFRAEARDEVLYHYDTIKIEDVDLKTVEKTSDGLFQLVDANDKVWKGRKLIITTGSENVFPDIPGYAEAWGQRMYVSFHHEPSIFRERLLNPANTIQLPLPLLQGVRRPLHGQCRRPRYPIRW